MPVCLQWLGSVFPRRLRRNAQKRGLAWYSVPCVTCCPMYADGDADALWRGIPVHCRGAGSRMPDWVFCVNWQVPRPQCTARTVLSDSPGPPRHATGSWRAV